MMALTLLRSALASGRRLCLAFQTHRHAPSTTTSTFRYPLLPRFASVAAQDTDDDASSSDESLVDASSSSLLSPTLPIPHAKSLSPSAILEFQNCPQSFLFQYLYGLRQPTSPVLAKGSMCHEALEQVFDLDPPDRTLEHLQNLFRSSWAKHRTTETYQDLFGTSSTTTTTTTDNATTDTTTSTEWDVQGERAWGLEGLQLLENYYQVEDPRLVTRPNPMQREVWVRANLSVDPTQGSTGYTRNHNPQDKTDVKHPTTTTTTTSPDSTNATFLVRGIVDRIDMVKISKQTVALRIVDYKSGKAPHFKYSPAMNEKIAQDVFFQLKIYALLLRERKQEQQQSGLDLRLLRLMYLTSESGRGQYLDMDLGETQEERDRVLQEVHADLSRVWTSIGELVERQDPKAFVGCDRSFCYCHKCRPRFVPGTVWEPGE